MFKHVPNRGAAIKQVAIGKIGRRAGDTITLCGGRRRRNRKTLPEEKK